MSKSKHRIALDKIRDALKGALIERDNQIDGTLAAVLCGQHVLLLGPPGTAKSALASILCKAFTGASFFEWLMSKFSTPEEILGPMSLKSIENDDFYRITRGKLAEAHIAFLDEIFKANSAILNALLTIINEGRFDNGSKNIPKVPLISMIGASNELPEGDDGELDALYDRFLVRYWVRYIVSRANMKKLLLMGKPSIKDSMTLDQLQKCQAEAAQVTVPDAMIEAVLNIKEKLQESGYTVSDRTWQRTIPLLRAYAYVMGDDEVSEDHIDILCDSLWREPKDRQPMTDIIGKVGNPLNSEARIIQDSAYEEVENLGNPPNSNGASQSALSDWRDKAGAVQVTLLSQIRALEGLAQRHPDRNKSKLNDARKAIKDMHQEVTERISDSMNLEV